MPRKKAEKLPEPTFGASPLQVANKLIDLIVSDSEDAGGEGNWTFDEHFNGWIDVAEGVLPGSVEFTVSAIEAETGRVPPGWPKKFVAFIREIPLDEPAEAQEESVEVA